MLTCAVYLSVQAAQDLPRAPPPPLKRACSARDRALSFALTLVRPASGQVGGSSRSTSLLIGSDSCGSGEEGPTKLQLKLAAMEAQHHRDSQAAAVIAQQLHLQPASALPGL